ncbi:MAG: T9SS type A sorting domain-containing protein, partial [Flavobacteriales bacterium]|nr:T9SS type A sorting domain-containing protein [Flavobacteriales bacterium]
NKIYNVDNGILLYNDRSVRRINANKINLNSSVASTGIKLDNSMFADSIYRPTLLTTSNEINYANTGVAFINARAEMYYDTIQELSWIPNNSFNCPPYCIDVPGAGLRVSAGSVVRAYELGISNGSPTNNTLKEGVVVDHSQFTLFCSTIENMGNGLRFVGDCVKPRYTALGFTGTFNGNFNTLRNSRFKNNHNTLVVDDYGQIDTLFTGSAWDVSSAGFTGTHVLTTNNTFGSGSRIMADTTRAFLPTISSNDASSSAIFIGAYLGTPLVSQWLYPCTTLPHLRKKPKRPSTVSNSNGKKQLSKQWLDHKNNRGNSINNVNLLKYEAQLNYLVYLQDSILSKDSLLRLYGDSMKQQGFGRLMASKGKVQLRNVVVNDPFDLDVQFVRNMHEQLLVQEEDTLPVADVTRLQGLAWSCPQEKGFAVLMARNVLGQMGHHSFRNDCENLNISPISLNGNGNGKGKKRLKSINSEVLLYPNPTQNELRVVVELKAGEQAEISFFDLLGKEVMKTQLSTGNIRSISTVSLENGMYLYQVYVNGVLLKRGKQMIQR